LSWGLPLPAWGLGEGTSLKILKSADLRGWALFCAAAFCFALPGAAALFGNPAHAGSSQGLVAVDFLRALDWPSML